MARTAEELVARAATLEQDIYAAAAVRCILASDAHLERVRAEREAAGRT